MITGERIVENDCVIAFESNGLHTNGFSLARKLLFEVAGFSIDDTHPESKKKISELLLAPHLNYTEPVLKLLSHEIDIHGMAHITGGGIWDNIPRVLPSHLTVEINRNSWTIPPIFKWLVELGHLDEKSAYHTFNMGLGFILMMSEFSWESAQTLLKQYSHIQAVKVGKVVRGNHEVRLIK